MKSNKQRRLEIKAQRVKRAQRFSGINKSSVLNALSLSDVKADHEQLKHNAFWGAFPDFYVDKPFVCRDCGSEEVWTAKQQKWWYEIAKGAIDSQAIRCRPCRSIERQRVEEARRISVAGLVKKTRREGFEKK